MDSKIKELLQEIIVKGYEINKNTKHEINVWFSGSTNQLEVFYYKDGIIDNHTRIETIYLDWENAKEKLQHTLNELKKLNWKEISNETD